MARALRDARFENVEVRMYVIVLDGREYSIDADLVQWQKDAITGPYRRTLDGMTPMTMQLDFERRSVKFLKTLPQTT